ncbi:MAG: hypothetical protein NC433_06420 [Clostridiales bacterium]|nr:hypothetical protein [Clostridiales bacterium]
MKYKMYVDNVMEYSRQKRKDAAWQKVRSDLMKSEKRMRTEGGINSGQLRKKLLENIRDGLRDNSRTRGNLNVRL